MVRSSLAVVVLLSLASSAIAQPVEPVAPIAVPPAAPEPPVDPDAVRVTYDRAFAALIRGDRALAERLFEEVAGISVEPDRIAAARELARFARTAPAGSPAPGLAAPLAVTADRNPGRPAFVVWSTMGAMVAGWALDDVLGITEEETTAFVITGSAIAGFAGSILATRDKDISEGMASSYAVGLFAGLGNGLLLAPTLGISVEPDCYDYCDDGEINQDYRGFALVSMAAGGLAGGYLGHKYQPTSSQARLAGLLGINGAATAGLLMAMAESPDDEEDVMALVGLGLDAGLAVGIAVGPKVDWSGARFTYVSLAEFLGGLTGFFLATLASDDGDGDSEQVYAGLMLAGLWGGFGGGVLATRDMRPARRAPTGAALTVAPVRLSSGGHGLGLAGTF